MQMVWENSFQHRFDGLEPRILMYQNGHYVRLWKNKGMIELQTLGECASRDMVSITKKIIEESFILQV